MATRAPSLRVAKNGPLTLTDRQTESGWRDLFVAEDAAGVWNRLSDLVRSEAARSQSDSDKLTQDLFLNILATGRYRFYLEAGFTEKMIEEDLLLFLAKNR